MRHSAPVLCALTLVLTSAAATAAPPGSRLLAVRCGHLVDTQAGALLGETTVVIDGQRIREVIADDHAPKGPSRSICRRRPARRG